MKTSTTATADHVELKVVGKSGQISLGKRFAGKTLRLERRADGTVLLTAVTMVPEHQMWTLQEPDRSRIARGLAWARATKPQDTDIDALVTPSIKTPGQARGRRR